MYQVFQVKNALAALVLVCTSMTANAKINNSNNNKTVDVSDLMRAESAKKSFTAIRDLAIGATSDAADLKSKIQNRTFTGVLECQELNSLRTAINHMGKQVIALENDRANLQQWQQDALDRVLPLLQHATTNVTGAIEYTKANPTWLVTPENQAYASKIERDSRQIVKTIDDYLKYEKARAAIKRAEDNLPAPVGPSGAND